MLVGGGVGRGEHGRDEVDEVEAEKRGEGDVVGEERGKAARELAFCALRLWHDDLETRDDAHLERLSAVDDERAQAATREPAMSASGGFPACRG